MGVYQTGYSLRTMPDTWSGFDAVSNNRPTLVWSSSYSFLSNKGFSHLCPLSRPIPLNFNKHPIKLLQISSTIPHAHHVPCAFGNKSNINVRKTNHDLQVWSTVSKVELMSGLVGRILHELLCK